MFTDKRQAEKGEFPASCGSAYKNKGIDTAGPLA